MKIADWHRIMKPGTMIRPDNDPRLLEYVGHDREDQDMRQIDPKPDFIANSEHAIFMHCLKYGIRPVQLIQSELGDIMRMPLGNHPERGLTCSRP